MQRDVGDIIDRWSIAKLKYERSSNNDERKNEFYTFNESLKTIKSKYIDLPIDDFATLLYNINETIWKLEAGSKGGKEELPDSHYIFAKENNDVLIRLGIINLLIKDINIARIKVKNIINKLTKTGFQDIKTEHLSEDKIKDS